MNRRNYFKLSSGLAGLAITSFSLLKWGSRTHPTCAGKLWRKRMVIAELAEMIIPVSDTPGAKMAFVDNYIIANVLNCKNAQQQHKFLSGIENIESYSLNTFGLGFMECNARERNKVLQHFSDQERHSHPFLSRIRNKILGKPFFLVLRDLTVEGYCQSKLGATQGLAYDHIPGSYEPCTSLESGQSSWATK